jgi:protein-S-isoprenylcysteine O-methyltransferase Ste14
MRAALSAVVIGVLSILIILLSRRSLRDPTSHGFFRFFAFEAIAILMVLNAPQWFASPFAVRQIVSWLLLILSTVFVVSGAVLLHRIGRPEAPPDDSSLYRLENTRNLVTAGVYGYVRHPLYASLLFLAWGAALKVVSLLSLSLGVLATVALFGTAKAEEAENLARWGEAYRRYMRGTRRFIPFVL